MEDVVYTLPEGAVDPEAVPMRFKNKHLPQANKGSGVVRFRSVTPKQRFIKSADQTTEDVMDEIHAAAVRHRELAADHIAAALWIKTEAPVVDGPALRVKKAKNALVTIPLDHEHVRPGDFDAALRAAGIQEGVYPSDPVYIGKESNTSDGRSTHTFEVTYAWMENA